MSSLTSRRRTTFTLLVLSASPAVAEPMTIDYTVDVSTVSSYVWRGDRLSSDAISPTSQPYGEVGFAPIAGGRLAAGIWTSAFISEDDPAYEIDPYVAFAAPAGPTTVTVGFASYLMPALEPIDVMHEVSAQVSYDELPIVPSLGLAVDPIRTDGWYAWGALSHQTDLGAVGVATRMEVGASEYAMTEAGLQNATFSSRASYPFGDGAYVAGTGAIAYSGRADALYPTFAVSVGVTR